MSHVLERFRLVTKPDFDGIACGILFKELDLIDRVADKMQVVYLTDDKETLEWARSRAVNNSVGLLAPQPDPDPDPDPVASLA